MDGFHVDSRYWRGPINEAMRDWNNIARLTERDEDGGLQISEPFYEMLDATTWQKMNRTPLGPVLKRLRHEARETFLTMLVNVRLGHQAISDNWDDQEARTDLGLVGLALGLQPPQKKRKQRFEWDKRGVGAEDVRTVLDELSERITRSDPFEHIKTLRDDVLLLGLRKFSWVMWTVRNRLMRSDHRFACSSACLLLMAKPKQYAATAVLGATYFDLFSDASRVGSDEGRPAASLDQSRKLQRETVP